MKGKHSYKKGSYKKGDGEEMDYKEGDDSEEEEKSQKSIDLSETDLEKSIEKLAEFTSGDATSRKDALLAKAAEGELEKSEREELFQILGGAGSSDDSDESLKDTVTKSMDDNESLQKALDVSDYLQEHHTELCKSLGQLAEHVEASDARQHEFNLVLAKAVADTGNLVKAMSERLGVVASQPARGPKSAGVNGGTKTLHKGFANQPSSTEELTKSQIMDGLDKLMEKSAGSEHRVGGEDVLLAISKYEQTNQISRGMLNAVHSVLAEGQSAH